MKTIDFSKYPMPNRPRHHGSPNLYMPLEDLKVVPDNYPPTYEGIDWAKFFGNTTEPKCLDIGCGKGSFLIEYALRHPRTNILGIEVRRGLTEWIKSVVDGEQLDNCSVIWYSVANGLPFIDQESIDKIFYLFPDPWPKLKHHKRRAFNMPFLDECARVMRRGASLYLATDLQYVHEYHHRILGEHGGFAIMDVNDDRMWDLPVTNKEKFCLRKDIRTYKIICRKK